MTDFEVREKQLRDRLAEVSGRLGRIEKHLEQTPHPDWGERATEAEMDEVLEGLGNSGNVEAEAIHAALARIKGGSYGICITCGKAISEERLDAVPYTPLCRNCAAAASA